MHRQCDFETVFEWDDTADIPMGVREREQINLPVSICSWMQKIFRIGNKRPLTEDDLFPIQPRLQSERLTALLEQ